MYSVFVGTNQRFKALLTARLAEAPKGIRKVAELVREADVPASAVSMVVSGERSLSHDVARRLGAVLCENIEERKELVELLMKEGQKSTPDGLSPTRRSRSNRRESVVQRLRRNEGINVGVIVCEPFVKDDTAGQFSGFAVELFRRLASLMQIKTSKWETLQLKQLEHRLGTAHEFDIIVTNLLPTFRRQGFMSFSRPFPYLGVPLSGLVSKELEAKVTMKGVKLHVEHLLSSPGPELIDAIRGARIMLITGEAGEEFSEAFFSARLMPLLTRVHSRSEDLAPKQLAESMLGERADLLIADVSTCRAVMDQREIRERYKPLTESEQMGVLLPEIRMGVDREKYPRLALYRIAFGLPKGDPEWKEMIDDAFECLMSEGIRSMLSLYREYLDQPGNTFRPFLISEDDTVTSQFARKYMESLEEIRELQEGRAMLSHDRENDLRTSSSMDTGGRRH